MTTAEKIVLHEKFWKGEGPSLLFIPQNDGLLYDMTDYVNRFHDPRLMWEGETARSRSAVGWPTDGIPSIRPNLGVIVVPALGGQDFEVTAESMPWPGRPMSFDEIRAIRDRNIADSPVYALLEGFYRNNDLNPDPEIRAYMADNQGVFDVAHLLCGDDIFYALMDPDRAAEVKEIMEVALDLFLRASRAMKEFNHEEPGSMIHGHGTSQGLYFPDAGIRISEDTATLLSPEMIDEVILPYVERSVEPFGSAFLHYCGLHPTLFDQLTGLSCIRAVDLGNPEKYDLEYLLERCARTGTVLYCRIPGLEGEHWRDYVTRVGRLVARTGARVVMRPLVVPGTREECEEMLGIWHELTAV